MEASGARLYAAKIFWNICFVGLCLYLVCIALSDFQWSWWSYVAVMSLYSYLFVFVALAALNRWCWFDVNDVA